MDETIDPDGVINMISKPEDPGALDQGLQVKGLSILA
jgi:hypothetical protein